MALTITALATLSVAYLVYYFLRSLFLCPLARIPGPKSFAVSHLRLAYEDYKGTRTRKLNELHQNYGPVVRVGPNEVVFNSLTALRTIYGAGSGYERTSFYSMFEAYGRKNMFTYASGKAHGERKKMLANAYAKSALMKGQNAEMIMNKVSKYLELLERDGRTSEIFSTLHFFSIDNITQFLYGKFGKTACLDGESKDRHLISDIMDVSRRKLTWFTVHYPKFTSWLYSQTGLMGTLAQHFYPMATPTTYTGIRLHAMKSCQAFSSAPEDEKANEASVISKLWMHHRTAKDNGLDDLDVAAECSDQLLAGIDTTSDTLMFLIWSLSRSEHKAYQQKVIDEVRNISAVDLNADGIPQPEVCDKLVYVDAVIKETLRLFAPLPASEPRSLPRESTIDGALIPARTVVSMSPYTLHRNPEVFKNPSEFNPDRWLDPSQDAAEMKKLFWAFSSGGRMCIGMQ